MRNNTRKNVRYYARYLDKNGKTHHTVASYDHDASNKDRDRRDNSNKS